VSMRRTFRWAEDWQEWVPSGWELVEDWDLAPLPAGPMQVEVTYHPSPCACPGCLKGRTSWTQGQRTNDYLKAKSLEW
jgi:hypothetical protein